MIPLHAILELPQALTLVGSTVPKIQAAIPAITKTLGDIKQAASDREDLTKLVADLEVVLADAMADFNALAALLPNSK